jgi:hypothetical protein
MALGLFESFPGTMAGGRITAVGAITVRDLETFSGVAGTLTADVIPMQSAIGNRQSAIGNRQSCTAARPVPLLPLVQVR